MATHPTVPNALSRYYDRIRAAAGHLSATRPPGNFFQPGWELPEPTGTLEEFFAVSTLSGGPLSEYRGRKLSFLDLTGNPGTRTTKTFGSAVIVARALRHTAVTGESVLLVSPSAANKAVALRDAVLRAYQVGAASPATLRVAVVVPAANLQKIWDSGLTAAKYSAANPIGVFDGAEREHVKKLATAAVQMMSGEVLASSGFRIWYTLDPLNYMLADIVRAFFEDEMVPSTGSAHRWHAHAVSSAYGLLGHDLGRRELAQVSGSQPAAPRPRYLLVQHLETPDLVLNLRAEATANYRLPSYEIDQPTGQHRQVGPVDPHFPMVCYSGNERLERTFYTRNPPTIPLVQDLLARQGGDGIVVSLPECLARYQEIRRFLGYTTVAPLPEDPRRLREWAGVMAVAGALTAIDRGLIPFGDELMVHCSGAYSEGDYEIPDRRQLYPVDATEDVAAMLRKAATA
jgi:hypothetical protein